MKNYRRYARFMAFILSLVMVVSGTSMAVFADEAATAEEQAATTDEAEAIVEDTEETLTTEAADEEIVTVVTLEAPTDVKVDSVSGTNVTLTWTEVEGVNYAIKVKREMDDDYVLVQDPVNSPFVYDAYYAGVEGSVIVGAYYEGSTVDTAVWCDEVLFETESSITKAPVVTLDVPAQGVSPYGSSTKKLDTGNLITISWTKATGNVASYQIIRLGPTGSEYKMVKNLDPSTTSYEFRGKAGEYSYKVRAIADASASAVYAYDYCDSAYKSAGEVESYLSKSYINDFCWYVTTKSKVTLYKKGSGSAKSGTIAKGQTGTAIGKYPKHVSKWDHPSRIQVKFKNGKTGWVKFSSLKFKANINVYKDFPIDIKLAYVAQNQKKIKTSTFIWVNKYTERVNIFKKVNGKWKLVRNCRCTVGNFYQPLSSGWKKLKNKKGTVYNLDDKGRTYYFKYSRTFGGSGYFHTRSYWANGGAKNTIFKNNHNPNTKGCCRLLNEDAKYIYGLPYGTTVLFK